MDSWDAVTSMASHLPFGLEVTAETVSGVLDGLREVAITLWPARRATWAISKPKPEEQPVISQVGVEDGIVNLVKTISVLNCRYEAR